MANQISSTRASSINPVRTWKVAALIILSSLAFVGTQGCDDSTAPHADKPLPGGAGGGGDLVEPQVAQVDSDTNTDSNADTDTDTNADSAANANAATDAGNAETAPYGEGTPCELNGATRSCGHVENRQGAYNECDVGQQTCTELKWGPCIIERFVGSSA